MLGKEKGDHSKCKIFSTFVLEIFMVRLDLEYNFKVSLELTTRYTFFALKGRVYIYTITYVPPPATPSR